MRQKMGVIVAATVLGLTAFAVNAKDPTPTKSSKATKPSTQAKAKADAPQDATASPGNTPVHRFFNAWGNGMQRGANAIGLDKNPLEGKLPEPRKPLFSNSNDAAATNR